MLLYKRGEAEAPPTEHVWFHIPNPREGKMFCGVRQGRFIPLDLSHLGVSGVREFLEKGNTWSGRGEYLSLVDQLQQVREANETARVNNRAEHKEANRHEMRESRRFRYKIPFLPVGINLRASKSTEQKEQ